MSPSADERREVDDEYDVLPLYKLAERIRKLAKRDSNE